MVYSNCSKVALYTDGVFFEVHSGEEKFVFEDIPAMRPCIMLTAEADGCIMSLSIQKSCIKRSEVRQALSDMARGSADGYAEGVAEGSADSVKTVDKLCESSYTDF